MPKTEEQNQKIQDKRKEELLEAALEEFSRKGYSGTKISDVIKRAEISQGLIYHYYKSKEELYLAVIEKSIELSMGLVETIRKSNLKGWSGIYAMTQYLVQWLRSGGEGKVRFFFIQQASMLEPMPIEVKTALAKSMEMVEFTKVLIEEAQKEGKVIEGDPRMLATIYWQLLQGIILSDIILDNIGTSNESNIPDENIILRIIKK